MRFKIIFLFIPVVGIALRLYFVLTAPFSIPILLPDTSALWLMAKHITRGDFPLFFPGQYFLSPLEPLSMAFFFKIYGIKIPTLFLANVFFSASFIISSYFLGKELKDKVTGLVMMLYAAFPTSYFFWASVMPGGYWIETLLIGNIMFILTLKIPQCIFGVKKTVYYMLLGLSAGIGFWTHYMIFYYFAPVGLYLLINDRWKSLLKNSIPAIISFFLISLPFWIFTFKYNFASFKFKPQRTGTTAGNFLIISMKNISDMFTIDFDFNTLKGLYISLISCIYFIAIVYFIFISVFRKRFFSSKNSLFMYLFVFLAVIYVSFRVNVNLGGTSNHLMPIFTFLCAAVGYLFGSVYRKSKSAYILLLIIFAHNIWDIRNDIIKRQSSSKGIQESVYNQINFFKDNNILRYVAPERDSRAIVFFSNEDIIATAFLDYEYFPYSDIVEASDRIAFKTSSELGDWYSLLKNSSERYDVKDGIFYNIKPFPYKTKAISPAGWEAESVYNSNLVNFAFDRNLNNFWTSGYTKKNGMSFTINMKNIYTICKMQIFNMHHYTNYPSSLKIQVSNDGQKWIDIATLECIQPLFWSGPRLYWHLMDGRVEVIFKPVKARFIKLLQSGEDPRNPWEINEIFIYEYLNSEEFKVKDYVRDVKEVTEFLINRGINFVYADFWQGARIRQISKGKIQALVPHTRFLPPRKNMSHEVSLHKQRAFVVSKENALEFESMLDEFELPYKRISFRKYNCYYFENLDREFESMPSFFWIGNNMIKHSLKESSKWYYKRAQKAEKEGDIDKSIYYYKTAIKYYSKNLFAYQSLAKYNISKYNKIIKRKFTPQNNIIVKFVNGIEFLGYSIKENKLKPGSVYEMDYFWTLKKELQNRLFIFVYFIKDNKIIFQNDHEFLFEYLKPLKLTEGERFKEKLKLEIPPDAEPGIYNIVMGLWNKDIDKRIKISDPQNKKKTKVTIGKIEISKN